MIFANGLFAGVPIPPITMEEATVQGKIIILENFEEDRQAAVGLLIEIWSAKKSISADINATGINVAKDELVLEIETDEDGFFYIEEGFELAPGQYLMVIGEVNIVLIVEPISDAREALQATEKQKTLLILVPKEIFAG